MGKIVSEAAIEHFLLTEAVPVLERVRSGEEKTYPTAEVRRRMQRRYENLINVAK